MKKLEKYAQKKGWYDEPSPQHWDKRKGDPMAGAGKSTRTDTEHMRMG